MKSKKDLIIIFVLIVSIVILSSFLFTTYIKPHIGLKNIEYRPYEIPLNYLTDCFEEANVTGSSMYPTAQVKDFIVLDRCKKPENLDVNDVIAFTHNNNYIYHRIISIDYNNQEIVTRGDNNLFFQKEVIGFEDYLGKVVWISSNQEFK